MLAELHNISLAKFVPTGRIVPKPFSELGAWREFLHPMINAGVRLLHTARPQPVNQDSGAIFGGGALVRPFQFDVFRGDFLAHHHRSRMVRETFTSLASRR